MIKCIVCGSKMLYKKDDRGYKMYECAKCGHSCLVKGEEK